MSLRIKKGDTVKVLAGSDKGESGKVLSVDVKNASVKVENVNMISRHRKARSAQEQSGIVKSEGNVDISNVMLICPSCGKATRIATIEVDGKSHRSCKKCGFDIDSAKPAAPAKKKSAAKAEKSTGKVKRTRKSDAKPAEEN